MMIGRFPEPKDPPEREDSSFVFCDSVGRCDSCAFRLLAKEAAIAEPKNPRRLIDINSPVRKRRKNNTYAHGISGGRARMPGSTQGTTSPGLQDKTVTLHAEEFGLRLREKWLAR